MKKRVLLQCQSLTYFYMGLAAVYTKYRDRDVIVDVLFTREASDVETFVKKLKCSEYVDSVYCFQNETLKRTSRKIEKLKSDFWGKFLFEYKYKRRINKIIKSNLGNAEYSDVFYSHELSYNLIKFIQFTYPNINLVIYGDGSGLLMYKCDQLINPCISISKNIYINGLKPDEIISLSPYIEDNSFDEEGIKVTATDKDVFIDIIEKDTPIQDLLNEFTDEVKKKYANITKKYLLLTTRLDNERFMMSPEDQIQIYIDIIEKYCDVGSLIILKLHPVGNVGLYECLKERLNALYTVEVIPGSLKEYPVEIFSSLLKELTSVISFISSSKVSLKVLYDINCIDGIDIIKNYNLIHRIAPVLDVYSKVTEKIPNWDKKSVIYKTDIVPAIKEFYEKYANSLNKNE